MIALEQVLTAQSQLGIEALAGVAKPKGPRGIPGNKLKGDKQPVTKKEPRKISAKAWLTAGCAAQS